MMFVLDACALIALFNREAGAAKVRDLILQAAAGEEETEICISPVNLLEVYYDRIRVVGPDRADEILSWIYASPIQILETLAPPILKEAGRLKTAYTMSLADSIACAAASCLSGILVTADHKELDPVENSETIHFLWFR
jgi:predicted nucleic acid-binding protein